MVQHDEFVSLVKDNVDEVRHRKASSLRLYSDTDNNSNEEQ